MASLPTHKDSRPARPIRGGALLAQIRRRLTGLALERLVEGRSRIEPDIIGNHEDRLVGRGELLDRVLDPPAIDIIEKTAAQLRI